MTKQDFAEHYRRIRREQPTIPARWALQWARTAAQVDELQARADWDLEPNGRHGLAIATIDGIEIRVQNDDEPFDWGDIEPTDEDRANLEVIGVSVGLPGEDDLEAVWGVSYLDGDWARVALETAVECGYLDTARRELSERAHWAARDTITTD